MLNCCNQTNLRPPKKPLISRSFETWALAHNLIRNWAFSTQCKKQNGRNTSFQRSSSCEVMQISRAGNGKWNGKPNSCSAKETRWSMIKIWMCTMQLLKCCFTFGFYNVTPVTPVTRPVKNYLFWIAHPKRNSFASGSIEFHPRRTL